jgi:hypothetical protein
MYLKGFFFLVSFVWLVGLFGFVCLVWGFWFVGVFAFLKGASHYVCSPGWPQIHDPPVSCSQVLGLQACTTTPGFERIF